MDEMEFRPSFVSASEFPPALTRIEVFHCPIPRDISLLIQQDLRYFALFKIRFIHFYLFQIFL